MSYEIFFISYQEPNADDNFKKLKSRFPFARRIHGIKGIHQAHIAAAQKSFTNMFWAVDGDSNILDSFNFDYIVDNPELNCVHVWKSINPINGLEYGYGGVKLLPKLLTINMDLSKIDMTTGISSSFKAVQEVSNISEFNTDPFNTWKSAFRECCKLSSKIIDRQKDDETVERLRVWCSVGKDKQFGEYAIAGAMAGRRFGEIHRGNLDELKKINNFAWLEEKFNEIQ
jgi:hypothetical protein